MLDAIGLINNGQTVELVASMIGMPPARLAEWICRYRRHGRLGFWKQPHRDRPPLATPEAVAEALRREQAVIGAYKLESEGLSQNAAAFKLGVPDSQLSRWRRAYEASGFEALLPKAVGFGPQRRYNAADPLS